MIHDNPSIPILIREATAARRADEVRALVFHRNLTERDAALLSDQELNVSWDFAEPADKVFETLQSKAGAIYAHPTIRHARYQYYSYLSRIPYRLAIRDISVDGALRPPKFEIRSNAGAAAYPSVRLVSEAGPDLLTFFEFDTSGSFDTPNLWRYPALVPMPALSDHHREEVTGHEPQAVNLTSRQGLGFNLFRSAQRDANGRLNEFRFPFRASTMRLPDEWEALDYLELQRHSRALAHGLSASRAIQEIYAYGRQCYPWGADNLDRSALDTFCSGVAQCSHVNNLIGAMLEMNGFRVRSVAGFDPAFRAINPHGGHSAIEVLDSSSASWRYVDPYLDVLCDTSAEHLAESTCEAASIPVLTLPRYMRGSTLGDVVTLGQLYRYRTYGDQLRRLPSRTMLQLRARVGEAQYGTDWKLDVAPEFDAAALFPEQRTIHARARYVRAPGRSVAPAASQAVLLEQNELPIASEWAHMSFEVRMREIGGGQAVISGPSRKTPTSVDV